MEKSFCFLLGNCGCSNAGVNSWVGDDNIGAKALVDFAHGVIFDSLEPPCLLLDSDAILPGLVFSGGGRLFLCGLE